MYAIVYDIKSQQKVAYNLYILLHIGQKNTSLIKEVFLFI